jgi:hypothetical protein
VNSYGEVSAIASESFADEQLTETVLFDRPFDRSDLYIPYVTGKDEVAQLFVTTAYQRARDNANKDGQWLGNEAFVALNVDYEKTKTFQTGKSVVEFLVYEADQISSGNFDKSFLFGQTAKVVDDITSTTPEQVKVKLEKVKKDADNYRENTSKEEMIVDAANMTADILYGTATGGALTRSTKLSNKLFGYDDKDIDFNGTKSPDSFDSRHSNNGTLDGGILRTVDGDFSIKYGSVIRGQSKIDDTRIDEIFRNPITGGYSKNISTKSGSPANYSINSGKPHSDNDTSAQVRKSIEANRLAYQHTPKNNGGNGSSPRPDTGRGVNASPVVPPSRGNVFSASNSPVTNKAGVDLEISVPKILSNNRLSDAELTLVKRDFKRKINALQSAARRGELRFSPGTGDIRISELQQEYRERVLVRFEKMFGVQPDIKSLDADHPIDLIVGGPSTQSLKMLHRSVNRSVGVSLRLAGERAGLNPGDPIHSIIVK